MENLESLPTLKSLRENLNDYPRSAGVYIMKDDCDKPLYIGKAVDLHSRIRSYLFEHDGRMQIPALLIKLHRIDWIATTNESEALILEANLVRKYKPRYNIELKDDKHYPYIKVTVNETFPRLFVVRRVQKDGGRYFGPYTDVVSMRRILSFARKTFKICECKRPVKSGMRSRPCINYEIGRCGGACAGKITHAEYVKNIDLLLAFLTGQGRDVIAEFERRMEQESEALHFEQAASLRDQIQFIRTAARIQNVDLRSADVNLDAFGTWDDGREICLCALCFREGLLLSKRHFRIRREEWEHARDGRDALILQYYQETVGETPQELLLPPEPGFNTALLEQWFASEIGRRVEVTVPLRGRKREIVEMAAQNARLYLIQKIPADRRDDLMQLQQALNLPKYPRTIEAFDISNIGKSFAVAAMVRFVGGQPEKSEYRKFRIRSVEGQNDFAMLLEVVNRRHLRRREEGKGFADLLLIDGGKGQLHAAMKPLEQYENPPMVVSLAKQREEIFSPYVDRPVRLEATHPGRKVLQQIRDEAHRFAISFHRTVRDRQFRHSALEDIKGIGPRRARSLLKRFGSLGGLRSAGPNELMSIKGLSGKTRKRLFEWLSK